MICQKILIHIFIEYIHKIFVFMIECFDWFKVARAGRFGTKGLAITYVADESDAAVLNEVQKRFEVQITEMPDEIDVATYSKDRFFIYSIIKKIVFVLVENRWSFDLIRWKTKLSKFHSFLFCFFRLSCCNNFFLFFSCKQNLCVSVLKYILSSNFCFVICCLCLFGFSSPHCLFWYYINKNNNNNNRIFIEIHL